MDIPLGTVNCPPGLQYLTMVDQLLIKQHVEICEVVAGIETPNRYSITNSMGQHVYYAFEDTDCLTRYCCGPTRPFDMKILDISETEVIHLKRHLACASCCFPCCLQVMDVYSPPGQLIGRIRQQWSFWIPNFVIENAGGDTVFTMKGPICTCSLGNDVEFRVLSPDGQTQVGQISKQWRGCITECLTDADNFGLTFAMDLDVQMKAVLLGAVFLIDFMYYESAPQQHIF